MLYKCLWEWAKEDGVEATATERFHFKYRLNEQRIQISRSAAISHALRHWRYLGRYDFRDALLRRITGPDTRTTRVLHTLLAKAFS
jgi:hypothetical protein